VDREPEWWSEIGGLAVDPGVHGSGSRKLEPFGVPCVPAALPTAGRVEHEQPSRQVSSAGRVPG
jgi:hypothetical protein